MTGRGSAEKQLRTPGTETEDFLAEQRRRARSDEAACAWRIGERE
jgi:hypothetical protein